MIDLDRCTAAPPNIDRLMPHLERLIERLPLFGEVGIKLGDEKRIIGR